MKGTEGKLLAGYDINKKSGRIDKQLVLFCLKDAKILKSSGAKYSPVKAGDNVCIRIPDVDRGRRDPRSVIAVVVNVEDAFYKL